MVKRCIIEKNPLEKLRGKTEAEISTATSKFLDGIYYHDDNMVTEAMHEGADLYKKSENDIPVLFYAIERAYTETLDLIFQEGWQPWQRSSNGMNCLMYAAQCGSYTGIYKSWEYGASVLSKTPDWNSALHFAANGSTKNIKFLIDHGALIDGQNLLGETPLMIALGNGNFFSVCCLLKLGADIEKLFSRNGETSLKIAMTRCGVFSRCAVKNEFKKRERKRITLMDIF